MNFYFLKLEKPNGIKYGVIAPPAGYEYIKNQCIHNGELIIHKESISESLFFYISKMLEGKALFQKERIEKKPSKADPVKFYENFVKQFDRANGTNYSDDEILRNICTNICKERLS